MSVKRRNMTALWLRLTGFLTAFVLVSLLGAVGIGRALEMDVVAYVGIAEGFNRQYLYILDVQRVLSSKITGQTVSWCCLSWSPDGSRIVFTSSANAALEIFMVDVFGGDLRQLTNNEVNDYAAVWSPDGSSIAYASERNGNSDIYVTSLADGQTRQITDESIGVYGPFWSPDGKSLIYLALQRGGISIYRVNADGDNVILLSRARDIGTLSFSPDGRHVLFYAPSGAGGAHSDVFTVDSFGKNRRQLTTRGAALPSWSPDGSQIVFSARGDVSLEIHVMDQNGDNVRRITQHPWNDLQPLFAPDGKRILFLAADGVYYSLNLINADGTNERRLAVDVSYIIPPAWRP
jgi:Tol biopolymer transport system component